ncbi:metal-dependent transcriptional regulator [Candidatus Hecatella orcuttiae]|jgi:DtxR family Mn-dependent transcriptional regulator|uniref:metal-dependent transcriptional regulator n=1 Tax=Candidatus Hecatella orcuttiae TaxID=1935119 RepID=UPI002867C478|nr:metal-dependent transcriptional regulator [Candidatus Hecatella orcuttiae]
MEISEPAEEVLEALWTVLEKKNASSTALQDIGFKRGDREVEELFKLNLIRSVDGEVEFTEEGRKLAEDIVRRHRLAERLLVDVLDLKGKLVEETACKFEHLLRDGVDEHICILLGHPKICPHGLPIPPGRCCEKEEEATGRIICPLSDLKPGEGGKIAYIYTSDRRKLERLMVMGLLPGSPVTLIQRSPSYVFQAGQTQIAVDEEIANSIYVRIVEGETSPEKPPTRGRRRFRFGLRKGW